MTTSSRETESTNDWKASSRPRIPAVRADAAWAGVVDYPNERPLETSLRQVLGNSPANRDNASTGSGAEGDLFLQQRVPSVVPLHPSRTRAINQHRSLGQIGHVVARNRFFHFPREF